MTEENYKLVIRIINKFKKSHIISRLCCYMRQLHCNIMRMTDGPSIFIAETNPVDLGLDVIHVIRACK